MKAKFFLSCIALAIMFSACNTTNRTPKQKIEQQIDSLLKDKKATVGVAVLANDETVAVYNNQIHFPLLSIFKFHVGLAVLDKMDKGHIALDSLIEVKSSQLTPNTYSPLRDKFPDQNITISLGELLKYTISKSDNNTCDILIEYVGGIEQVNEYVKSLGIKDCNLAATETLMHTSGDAYLNWSTPEEVVRLLNIADKQPLFGTQYKDFLQAIMQETSTGKDKLKGQLPADVIVGHKTGSSDRTPEGIKIADNDAGFVILPNGQKYYIAVFVMESQETDADNAAIIASISQIVYDTLNSDIQ